MIRIRIGTAERKAQWSIVTAPASELLGDADSLANIDLDQRIVFIRPGLNGMQLGYVLATVARVQAGEQVEP